MPFTRPPTPGDALARLLEGNRRYVAERPQAPVASAQRIELASGQEPFAVVLGCSDSRVPIESVFDQHPGNLFVIRLAGNIVTSEALASMEYAIDVLHSMFVLVLGHEGCGAVRAAMSLVESDVQFPGSIGLLAEAIAPAARAARTLDGDWWRNAIESNARTCRRAIVARSPIVRAAVARGDAGIAAATYDLHTGVVTTLD
ncbi:MAG TPA: carbonic anhydrase [Candidatus Acidoferrales bacterium]|nr:carbonic anhydrase [Candidatus Acidoferrales bacterium]